MWMAVVWIASLAISYALTPKPQNAKASGLGDFQAPTAEEGREIPVLFGTRDISGPNVVWYGDLRTRSIKKRSGFSKTTVGYKYDLGMHMAICHGPIDRLLRIQVGGKDVWLGDRSEGRITINKSGIFGGDSREGGISGSLDFEPGWPDQPVNDYLQSQLGSNVPAFRGVSAVVLRRMYLGTSAYLKPWTFRPQRIHVRENGLPQWYGAKAEIAVDAPFREPQFFFFVLDQSGSMGTQVTFDGLTRMDVMKMNMHKALDEIDRLRIDSKTAVSIGLAAFSSGYSTISRTNVSSADIAALKTWVSNLVADGGTNFAAGITPAVAWFDSQTFQSDTALVGRRACFFITDGAPSPAESAGEAVALAADLLDRRSGRYNESDGTQVEMFGINIDLETTYWTEMLDNTRRDGVPVISGGDSNALWNAIYFATMGPSAAMNPAHIIRECLTDPVWGMGHPEADIDEASFIAAADQLHAEGMGISLQWDRSGPIEDFVEEIARHIDASVSVDNRTGRWRCKLIRGDYNADDLLILDESNVERLEDFSRTAFGELTNSVTVQYWDIASGKDATVTLQDIALVQMQGVEISTTVQYPGFTTGELAGRIAARDLRTLSTPRISCTLYTSRVAAELREGDVFKLRWPDYGIGETIMRVTEIAYGDGRTNKIRIRAVQDVFGLPATSYIKIPEIEWQSPDSPPEPAPHRLAFEQPYYLLVQQFGQAQADALLAANPDAGYIGIAATRPRGAINAVLATDSGAGYEEVVDALDFCPTAVTTEALDWLDTVVAIADGEDLDLVEPGSLAQLGDELIAVDDVSAASLIIRRGVLDTVPARHPVGTRIFFLSDAVGSDEIEYAADDQVDVKVLPVSGGGQLELAAAPVDSVTLQHRALRPYPPGDFKINGAYFPSSVLGPVGLSWVSRNRLQQTVGDLIGFTDGPVTPEEGTTYTVRIYDADTDVLRHEATDIAASPYVVSAAELLGALRLRVELWAVRDGLESYQAHQHTFEWASGDGQMQFQDGYSPPTDADTIMQFQE